MDYKQIMEPYVTSDLIAVVLLDFNLNKTADSFPHITHFKLLWSESEFINTSISEFINTCIASMTNEMYVLQSQLRFFPVQVRVTPLFFLKHIFTHF